MGCIPHFNSSLYYFSIFQPVLLFQHLGKICHFLLCNHFDSLNYFTNMVIFLGKKVYISHSFKSYFNKEYFASSRF